MKAVIVLLCLVAVENVGGLHQVYPPECSPDEAECKNLPPAPLMSPTHDDRRIIDFIGNMLRFQNGHNNFLKTIFKEVKQLQLAE
uniref:Uncharacterized protein n=1 Tax=Anopheles dirus TaxID=7168 RepID=A0A182NXE3_9DIPT